MTDYEELMLSGYVKRNNFRMAEKISGLLDVLAYFGVDRDVQIVEVEKLVPVPGPIQYITGATVEVEKEIFVSGELRLDGTDKIIITEEKIVNVPGETVYLPGETIYEEIEVEKEIYVSGQLRLDATDRIVITEQEIIYRDPEPDPQAELWNNTGVKQDIVYAGRTLKYEDNEELLGAGLFSSTVAQYGASGIPNYYKQTPFDVKLFVQNNDAVLKYYINKYQLKKETDDETIYAIENWVMFGSFEYSMPTLNTEINDMIKTPPIALQLGSLLTGDWNNQFILQTRPKLNSLYNLTFTVTAPDLANVYGNPTTTRDRVLLYSSDRTAEQTPTRADRPINKAYDYWQFPFETLYSGFGDCEEGAILIAALAINAGIPSYKIRVAVGQMGSGSSSEGIAHVWCIYLASDNQWRVIDWCNGEDINEGFSQTVAKPILQKMLAKNNNTYGTVWFTFNNEYSWLGAPY
jgi:hypothetical protein